MRWSTNFNDVSTTVKDHRDYVLLKTEAALYAIVQIELVSVAKEVSNDGVQLLVSPQHKVYSYRLDFTLVLLSSKSSAMLKPKIIIEVKKGISGDITAILPQNLVEMCMYSYYLMKRHNLEKITCCLTDSIKYHLFTVSHEVYIAIRNNILLCAKFNS